MKLTGDDEGEYTEETKRGIRKGLKDIVEGRVVSLEEIIKRLHTRSNPNSNHSRK
jgi:predicted transcriptional regulator